MSKSRLTQLALLALACAMIVYGAWRGEALALLIKGSAICLECIGLG